MRSIGVLVFLAALVFGAALVLDLGGIQSRLFADGPDRPPPPVAKLPAPAPSPKPAAPITPAWYLGATGYQGAELERQAARASMVVYFQKRKCDACRRFEHEVLGAPEVHLPARPAATPDGQGAVILAPTRGVQSIAAAFKSTAEAQRLGWGFGF